MKTTAATTACRATRTRRARVISRILTQFEEFPPEDLDYMLEKLGDALTA